MTAIARKPPTPVAAMSEAERKALKGRFIRVAAITMACCAAAFVGMVGNVSLHQWWGMPLFVLAMLGGFGSQIAFILGLVKANRTDKGA
ncbi:MAG TPA: hypothetical protein VL358_10140 [Caulobacteraceae bacterium]|nr:hypothetical protein [Caulobacteraceae bacterium]